MRKKTRLTVQEREAIVNLVRQDIFSQADIARQFGVSKQLISQMAAGRRASTARISARLEAEAALNKLPPDQRSLNDERVAAIVGTTASQVRTWRKQLALRAPPSVAE